MEEKLKKVRNRGSYKYWNEWLEFLSKKPSAQEIIGKVFMLLDRKHAFKSMRNSLWVEESINQLFRDKKVCESCEHKLRCLTKNENCKFLY